MRFFATALISALAAAGCAHQSTDPLAADSPEAALDAYYAGIAEADLPRRPAGAPALSGDRLARIGFASCMQQRNPAPALQSLAGEEPDLVVLMGDNVYGDAYSGDMSLPELRQAYADLAANPDFQTINAAAPILPVWDDHDFGMNDAGASFSARRFAQRIFNQFWEVPAGDARRSRPGVYHAEMVGPPGEEVNLILLDTRYFRSPLRPTDERGAPGRERYMPDDDPTLTQLGDAQWAWLEEELQRPAALHVIVSSIQVVADGHGWERWGNFPRERERLYQLIEESGADNVVLISGDRHRAGLYRLERESGAVLSEMTASSLNLAFPGDEEAGPHRVGPTFVGENYGVMDIDWDAQSLTLRIMDADGAQALAPMVVGFGEDAAN